MASSETAEKLLVQSDTAVEDPKTEDENEVSNLGHRPRKKHLYEQILRQLEFYLGDANLSKDRFLSKKLKDEPQIPLQLFLTFNKIRNLTLDVKDLVVAVKKSTVLSLTPDDSKVFRTTPLKKRENQDECTIYVENLPPDAEHEWIQKVFSSYGNVLYVSIPKYKNKANKGFAFIEFDEQDSVAKALQAFGAVGCRLPDTMPCDQLLSIKTFEDDGGKSLYNAGKRDNPHDSSGDDAPKKRKRDSSDDGKKSEDEVKSDAGEKSEVGIKSEDAVAYKSEENSAKRKRDSPEPEPSVKRQKQAEEINDEAVCSEESTDAEDDDDKKRRLRNRKNNKHKKTKKKHQLQVASLGLQILSKIEWKRLRNSYLKLQRQKMSALKKQLFEISRQNQEKEVKVEEPTKAAPNYDFTPGVILKYSPETFVEDINSFKTEARAKPGVAYVDIVPDRIDIFLRCESAEAASSLLSTACWPNTVLLTGEEEKSYWQKISEDRDAKLNRKRDKERGRTKLLQRAEKILKAEPSVAIAARSHIRFIDEDEIPADVP